MESKNVTNEDFIETFGESSSSSFSSKKRSPIDTEEISTKKLKKQSSKDDNRGNNVSEKTSITDSFSSEDQKERKITDLSICDNRWFVFNEKLELNEMKLDCYSSLKWCPNFLSEDEGSFLFKHLMNELTFEHTQIKMYGKLVNLARFQSWLAEENVVVRELFQSQKQHVWTPPMRIIKRQIEKLLNAEFDYCLVNLYRNGDDYIGFHGDNETKDLIASLSLGATRRFLVRHRSCFKQTKTRQRKPLTNPEKTRHEFSLTNGFLIAMLGETQMFWKHSIPKEKKVVEPRINLTFRRIAKK